MTFTVIYRAKDGALREERIEAARRAEMGVKPIKVTAAGRKTASVQQQGTETALRKAYDYWLKANASLKSMGIYELPLPDALQAYQAGLDLDE